MADVANRIMLANGKCEPSNVDYAAIKMVWKTDSLVAAVYASRKNVQFFVRDWTDPYDLIAVESGPTDGSDVPVWFLEAVKTIEGEKK